MNNQLILEVAKRRHVERSRDPEKAVEAERNRSTGEAFRVIDLVARAHPDLFRPVERLGSAVAPRPLQT